MSPPVPSRRQRYLTVIVRACLIVTVAFIFAEVTGRFFVDNFLPKTYAATAAIQIASEAAEDPSAEVLRQAHQADIKDLKSANVLLPVILTMGLEKSWATRVFERYDFESLSQDEALTYLDQHLRVEASSKTGFLYISVISDVPREAADIANAIADRYQVVRRIDQEERNGRREKAAAVQIVSRAVIPVRPIHHVAHMVTNILSVFFALTAASFVEMVLLFRRAGERED